MADRERETVVVLGATSGIARAICQELGRRKARLLLAGRDGEELARLAADLRLRHAIDVFVEPFEALDFAGHADFVKRVCQQIGGPPSGVVLCYGFMADQRAVEQDFALAQRTIDVNFTSPVSVLEQFATRMRRGAYIAALSSVAGDRGRQSNYTYGAAKAALTAYLSGLRNRLTPAGVTVLTIKPGFVATAMTDGRVNPRSPLLVSPERAARAIVRAIDRRKDVAYVPWFWRPIMTMIGVLPEPIFKRLKL